MKSRTYYPSLIVLLAAVVSGCASEPKPGAIMVDENDPNRIVCHDEAPTGSRLPKRTCKTAREWDEIAEANQMAKRNLRRSASHAGTTGTSGKE